MPTSPKSSTFSNYGNSLYSNQKDPSKTIIGIMTDPSNENHPLKEPNNYIYQRQEKIQKMIIAYEEEMSQLDVAEELIFHGFPSLKRLKGTEHFFNAFMEIKSMLIDSTPLNLTRSIFLVENAYLENSMKYNEFQRAIDERVQYCYCHIRDNRLNPKDNLVKNMAIYSLLIDTLNIHQYGSEKTIVHYPVKYNLNDYDSKKNFTSHFVSTLMRTNLGQCYSMPLLYLILAEKMGAKAYMSYAPNHSFIKIQDDNGAWYNLEITSRAILSDYHYMNHSFIKTEAIRNKIYLSPQSPKETIADMLAILGQYYLQKYGYDSFILDCAQLAKKYAPNNIFAKLLEADYETRLTLEIARLINAPNPQKMKNTSLDAYKHYERMHELYKQIDDCGYEKMPTDVYEKWLNHIEELKKQEKMTLHPQVRMLVK